MSSINVQLQHFHGPESYIPAMHRLTDIAKNNNFTTGDKFGTAWSKIFATWVTDEVKYGLKICFAVLHLRFLANRC